ncbi:MAG: TonB-dependent receptor, partial [Steroidobacteraceae bacterium]
MFVPLLPAHAQIAAETSASPSPGLDEIVITARRKEELLQDVPETVTPVTAADIVNFNFQSLSDISQVVPGLQIVEGATTRSLDSNTFRGVSFQPATGTQNTLGFYMNDTFVTNNYVTQSIFDIGQIELLSGPQGTLRGEPSPSGSLTITTHRPDLEHFGGYITSTLESYGQTNENGALNIPLIQDKLAVRLAGMGDDDDLDGVRSVNSPSHEFFHNYAGRVSLRYDPIDTIDMNLMYQNSYWQEAQFQQVVGPGAVGGANPLAPANYNGPPISATQLLGVQTYPNTQWNHSDIWTGQLDWHDFFGQRLSYVGSYWEYANNNANIPLAANQAPGIDTANQIPLQPFQPQTPSILQITQTQELRLSSETPLWGLMDYTAGGFFRYTRNTVNTVQLASFLPGSFGSPLGLPDPFTYNSKYTLQTLVDSPADEKEYSEFANFTFHLPKDTELTVGGRHIDYKKTGTLEALLLPNGVFAALPPAALGLPAGLPCAVFGFGTTYPNTCDIPASVLLGGHNVALPLTPQDLEQNTWIYNVTLSHKWLENLLTYANVGSSWRPGGAAVGINNAANDATINSLLHVQNETSTDFEVGVKWTFLENRARLNVSAFHQKFENFIYSGLPITYLSDNGVTTSPAVFSFTSNPDAVLNGVNLDTGFRPTRQWSIDLNATYTNGHLTGSEIPCNPPGGAFPPGAPPPYIYLCPSHASISVAPNFNSALQSEYDMPLPG